MITPMKRTKIRILAIIVAVLLVTENAFEVDCEPHFNTEKSFQTPENLTGLIFTEENRLNIFDPINNTLVELVTSSKSKPENPIYSCKRKTLYWIDENWKIQAMEDFKSQSSSVIYQNKEFHLRGLALDFISDKIYLLNFVFCTIDVLDLKTGNYGIVRSEKLEWIIKSVAVDPNEGYLFVLGNTELIRMDLDGLNSHYLLQGLPEENKYIVPDRKSLGIDNIALNSVEKRVYWMNSDDGIISISSITYDGTDRKLHLKFELTQPNLELPKIKIAKAKKPIPASIVFFSNILYLIDNSQGAHTVIRRLNLSDANDNEVIYNTTTKQIIINSVNCDANQPQVANPCDKANGGCQHLCLLSHSSESKYRCFCNLGYELASDGKSCILPTKFVAFTQDQYIRGINLREDTKQYIDVLDPSKFISGTNTLLDVDSKEGVLFYSNYGLHSFDMNTRTKVTLQPDKLSQISKDIAFDWMTYNFYYFSTYYGDITYLCVLNTKNATYNKILAEHRNFDFGLAVHPNKGYVFFLTSSTTKWFPSTTNLTRIHTDGSNSTMLLVNRNQINGIAIDYVEDKLYWGEIQPEYEWIDETIIYYSNLDGKDVKKIEGRFRVSHPGYPDSVMAIQEDWIYLLADSRYQLTRLPKKGGKLETLICGSFRGLRIFDPSIQTTRSDHPCVNGENNCEKFCFAVPRMDEVEGLQRVCGCPYGEKLADDGRSCVDNSKEQPPFIPCPPMGFRCAKPLEKTNFFKQN